MTFEIPDLDARVIIRPDVQNAGIAPLTAAALTRRHIPTV